MKARAVMSVFLVLFFVITGFAFVSGAFAAEKDKVTGKDVKKESREAVGTTGAYLDQKKDDYVNSVEKEYDRLSREISDLKDRAGDKASAEYREQLAGLERSRDAVGRKLEDLRDASSDTWEDMKSGMDEAMQDLKAAYNRTLEKMKVS